MDEQRKKDLIARIKETFSAMDLYNMKAQILEALEGDVEEKVKKKGVG